MNTKSKDKLVFLPLGGTGEIGMNMVRRLLLRKENLKFQIAKLRRL